MKNLIASKPVVIKSVCDCILPTADDDKECCRNCGKFLNEEIAN